MSRVVLVHEEMGVFIGSCMGLGFWTLLDDAGQTSVVTFSSELEAKGYITEVDDPSSLASCRMVPVTPDEVEGGQHFLSFAGLREQGLGAYVPGTIH